MTSEAYRFERDRTLGEIRVTAEGLRPGQETNERVRVAGRLMSMRRHGGITFAHIADGTGAIQLVVNRTAAGVDVHRRFGDLRRGDWVGAEGVAMRTRRGELSVKLLGFEILAKAARSLPVQRGLGDVETRYRQRYVDLIVNPQARRILDVRLKVVSAVRDYLAKQGFREVETPILGTIQGGAAARPFVTHHNALNLDLYLRIALELHLKRLIVGHLDRVFEIGRVFRNEGTDTHHNPEFTMLEAYQAFADYRDMMSLTEGVIAHAARAVLGDAPVARLGTGAIDLKPPWPRMTMAELIAEKVGVRMAASMPVEEARRILDGEGLWYRHDWGAGRLMKRMYDEKAQHRVTGPLFVVDFPREVSPLARVHRDDPALAERFELIIGGHELCNAFSEQNDPIAQRQAFEAEALAKKGGDVEAGDVDDDYLRALEYGMPCTGGLGLGIDRLVMLLAGVESIREVILFPGLRPEAPRGARIVRAQGRAADVGATIPARESMPGTFREPTPGLAGGVVGARTSRPTAVVLLAGLTALGGIAHVLTLVPFLPSRAAPFAQFFRLEWFRVTGHVVTLLIGLFLLFLADQLAKGKRAAWRAATALFALAAVMNVLRGFHLVRAAYAAFMTTGLLLARGRFRAPGDPPSLLRLVRVAPLYVLAVTVFGVSSLWIERHHVVPRLSVGGVVSTILYGLVGLPGSYEYSRRFFAHFFPIALLALGLTGLAGLLVLLFRPLVALAPHTKEDWEHAIRLVRRYGWDTLAYFALRDDKSFFFSSDGEAMIAYTYLGGYALVSGDPIGAPDSIPDVLDDFLVFCGNRAWNPAFLAVRQADLPMYAARGFHHLYLGDEAVIRCDTFTLDGAEMKGVREAVRRVGRAYRFEIMPESQAPARLVDELNDISRRWRGRKPERGFTMALSQAVTGQGKNPEFLLCIAFDDKNVPGGFLRLVPAYGADFGYTLDLMRHDPGAPNGMTEFLVARTAIALKERAVVRLSLNFAAFGRLLADDVQRTLRQQAARFLVGFLNPFFQVASLRRFNAKFFPQWHARALVFRTPIDLPRVGILYIGAEGLLSIPGIGPLLVPRSVGGMSAASVVPQVATAAPARRDGSNRATP